MKMIMEQNVLLYVMAAVGVLSLVSQMIRNRCFRLLIREVTDGTTGKRDFMKKLRARYRMDQKRSGGNPNLEIFLSRNLMDYRYRKLSLHQWKRLEIGLYLFSMAVGASGILYSVQTGFGQVHITNILWTAAAVTIGAAVMALWLDIRYKESYLKMALKDYFSHFGVGAEHPEVEMDSTDVKENLKETAVDQIEPQGDIAAEGIVNVPKKAPAIVGIRRKHKTDAIKEARETKAQRDKRELKENLTRINAGAKEAAAETERNREILRQMDPAEQERIIRDVLAEFLA